MTRDDAKHKGFVGVFSDATCMGWFLNFAAEFPVHYVYKMLHVVDVRRHLLIVTAGRWLFGT